MAVLGADGTPYITQGQAMTTLRELFDGVHNQMLAEGAEVRALTAQLRTDVQQAVTAAQTGAEEQVETLRGHTRTAVTELEAKLASPIESMELYEAARLKGEEEFMAKMKKFEQGVHEFCRRSPTWHSADDCRKSLRRRRPDEAVPGEGSTGVRPKGLQD